MKKWGIFGYGLPKLYISADSFDEALNKARKINVNYCGGVIEED